MKTVVKYLFKGIVMTSILICGMGLGLGTVGVLFYLLITGHDVIVIISFVLTFIGLFSLLIYKEDKQKAEKNDNTRSN
jgi:hypothetical protein